MFEAGGRLAKNPAVLYDGKTSALRSVTMIVRTVVFYFAALYCLYGHSAFTASAGDAKSADDIIQGAVDYMRGVASVSVVDMTIHRPGWERTMTVKAWTEGREKSVFRITAPPKDQGNATLLKEGQMWTFNPKINRVIKIPPSMMSQSWMGSDFSNNDLAKSTDILRQYTHTLVKAGTHEGKTVYVIKSVPRPKAPVVWGMQKHRVREDYVLLEQTFYDQDMQPVKELTTRDIRSVDSKLFPMVWKMQKTGHENEWTLLEYKNVSFKDDVPDRLFTLQALRTPRR